MSTPDQENASPSPEHSGDDDAEEMGDEDLLKSEPDDESSQSHSHLVNGSKPATNLKDPNRQKRKKARRACLACQRAHLTCSDERPCGRCIRRGLQDQCQDGVRKKAKYLHDAPNDALIPPNIIGSYGRQLNGHNGSNLPPATPLTDQHLLAQQQGGYFPQSQGSNYMYAQSANQSPMPPPVQDPSSMHPYSGQSTPISPPYSHNPSQHTPPIQSMGQQMQQGAQSNNSQMQNLGGNLFDPNDPSLFNFDVSSLNFGNHYGALEFSIINQMSSGAGETPPHEASIVSPLQHAMYHANNQGSFSDSPVTVGGFDSVDWQMSHSRQNSSAMQGSQSMNAGIDSSLRHDPFHSAYSIGVGPRSMSNDSPGSTGQEGTPTTYENTPVSPAYFVNTNQQQVQHQQIYPNRPQLAHQNKSGSGPLRVMHPNAIRGKKRDTTWIYRDLKDPYQYTQAFHRFDKIMTTRFPPEKRMDVAKAMANIRPSFINCTKDLDEQDLVAQEQTFQRKLIGYEENLLLYGTPTLVVRRSGEVAAVSNEFTTLTGWDRSILLGHKPNLNNNWDAAPNLSQNNNTSSRNSNAGNTTPLEDTAATTNTNPSNPANPPPRHFPVMLAELLDHDSVVRFYKDFSRLAFGDARGQAKARVKLMRYIPRTDDDLASGVANGMHGASNHGIKNEDGGMHGEEKTRIAGRMQGVKERVDCMMCWCVWHDQFDMPGMIVLNFLPITQHLSPQAGYKHSGQSTMAR